MSEAPRKTWICRCRVKRLMLEMAGTVAVLGPLLRRRSWAMYWLGLGARRRRELDGKGIHGRRSQAMTDGDGQTTEAMTTREK